MHHRPSPLFTVWLSAAALFHSGCTTSGSDSSVTNPRIVFPHASINGQPVRAILDTGTNEAATLDMQEARRLGLRITSTPNPAATAPANGLTAPAELTLAAVSVVTPIPTSNLPDSSADMLVGWPGVKDNLLLFMGALHTVAIVTGDDEQVPDTNRWLKVKTSSTANDVLILEIPRPDGATVTVLVDTGDPNGLSLAPDEWTVGERQADYFPLGVFRLTNVPIRNFNKGEYDDILGMDGHLDGVLGLGALARMDLVVDGKHGVAYLLPLPPTGIGAAGTANPPAVPADQNQDWSVVRQTGLRRAALILTAVNYKMVTQDNDGAIADCTRALDLDPLDADAWFLRAAAKELKEDHAGAIADCTHAIGLDSFNMKALAMRATVNEFMADYDGALVDYNRALELAPQDPINHGYRAMVRELLGDAAGALVDYNQAIALDVDDSNYPIYCRLYRQLLQLQQGTAPAGFAQTVGGWKAGWVKTIGQFVAGKLDETALLAAAEKSDVEPVTAQRCEAWYYVGKMRLLKGDQAGARDAFQKSLATNQRSCDEYLFAHAALAHLPAAGKN